MSIDRKFAALADPTRRHLLGRLGRGPCEAGRLAQGFRMSRPAVAKHLRVLVGAGLIEAEAIGRNRFYRLVPQGLQEVREWIAQADRMSDAALQSFQRYVEDDAGKTRGVGAESDEEDDRDP